MSGAETDAPDLDLDVLIVGAGPVGMLGGILAARRGLRVAVLERRDGPQTAPAAHAVNARTFEICRQAGVDINRLAAAATPVQDSGHVNFVTNLSGELIGRLPYERQTIDDPTLSPTPLRNLSQHNFEPILADEFARVSGTTVRYGAQWDGAVDDGDGVTSTVTDVATGRSSQIRSHYLIGCDGAGSRVRKSIDVEMEGPALIQAFVMIHLDADFRALVAERPGVLHFVLDPAAEGVFVAHDIDHDWVFMKAFDPDTESAAFDDEAHCRQVVLDALGTEADFAIAGVGSWRMSAQIADAMRRGRIFLAGDAAHRFPPTGGMGLNTGAGDIHGLIWRLGAVIDGWAGDALLDTYATERLPIAHHNSEQSLTNALKMVSLAHALGTDEDPTTERLETSLRDGSRTAAIAAAVDEQAEHFDMVGLQLGYVYAEGALQPDGEEITHSPTREYRPTGRAGARLPHAPTSDGRSTLDLVDPAVPTLLTFGCHDDWAEIWPKHLPHVHERIGEDVKVDDGWRAQCGVGEGGALVLRPDQHVAWRATDASALPDLATAVAALT